MNAPGPFARAILKAGGCGRVPLIADIKPVSPRDGVLVGERNTAVLARALAGAGACALSVVTEAEHFGGRLEMLRDVAAAVPLPVLRKDFFSFPEEIDVSREHGAAAVLLTLATIPEGVDACLYRRAQSLGLDAVVEVHTADELARGLALGPGVIGINNRDIMQLEKDPGDVSVTETLAPLVPDGVLIISESALCTADAVRRAVQAGAHAVLIGTALLLSPDPAKTVAELTACMDGESHGKGKTVRADEP